MTDRTQGVGIHKKEATARTNAGRRHAGNVTWNAFSRVLV